MIKLAHFTSKPSTLIGSKPLPAEFRSRIRACVCLYTFYIPIYCGHTRLRTHTHTRQVRTVGFIAHGKCASPRVFVEIRTNRAPPMNRVAIKNHRLSSASLREINSPCFCRLSNNNDRREVSAEQPKIPFPGITVH